MNKVIVLGAGRVGGVIAINLMNKYDVTLADIDQVLLERRKMQCPELDIVRCDVRDKAELSQSVKSSDMVVCAVPGYLGFETLRQVIEAGKNVVDISFCPENTLDLDNVAKNNGVTAIVDCGIAPGMDNIILGYYNQKMTVTHFECLVGGLPKIKKWPFYYKAPFSPYDVIEEYTRPARYMESGRVLACEPMEDTEFVEFDKAGELESFLTDGLRSLLITMPHIPSMKEKTLRYPGHADLIKAMKKSGFFSRKTISVKGAELSPFDFTGKILADDWQMDEKEEDITVMRVVVEGSNIPAGKVKVVYNLYDEYSRETGITSMARTTGYTACAAADMILDSMFTEKGVFPPELIGKHEMLFKYFISYLEQRNIHFKIG